MTILDMLKSNRSGLAARGIIYCVARGNPTSDEIRAIQYLEDSPNSNECIMHIPLSSVATAAMHVIHAEEYVGNIESVRYMFELLSNADNLTAFRNQMSNEPTLVVV